MRTDIVGPIKSHTVLFGVESTYSDHIFSFVDGSWTKLFCLTSKMSHDHSRRGSCGLRLMILWLHSIQLWLAGDVTEVVVGSGALLGCSRYGNQPQSNYR